MLSTPTSSPRTPSSKAAMGLRRWDVVGQGTPSPPAAPRSARLARKLQADQGRTALPAVAKPTLRPAATSQTKKAQEAHCSSEGAQAIRDLRLLTADDSDRPLAEKTLDAAQEWSIGKPVEKTDVPSRGLDLTEVTKQSFFGRLSGSEIEAELQRHAMLLKGLLRDVAVMRDVLWHLADERSEVTKALAVSEKNEAELATLRTSVDAVTSEVAKVQSEMISAEVAKVPSEMMDSTEVIEEQSQALDSMMQGRQDMMDVMELRFEELSDRMKMMEEAMGLTTAPNSISIDVVPWHRSTSEPLSEHTEGESLVVSETDDHDAMATAVQDAAALTARVVMDQIDEWFPEAALGGFASPVTPSEARTVDDTRCGTAASRVASAPSDGHGRLKLSQELDAVAAQAADEVARSVARSLDGRCSSRSCSRCTSRRSNQAQVG
eukprot:TRINITY_DN22260_c0_g1_i1.p1 TRINITY_DN22260_c0_g1~~TRINITY_DN22260_c0_g1_i1.p1  ORF type:complete len:435 (+),score=107.56 TRINITY_DN22260_c0_g1_i1:58-1362(+)